MHRGHNEHVMHNATGEPNIKSPEIIYKEFSHILSGCDTILDAMSFAATYILYNPSAKDLIHSMVNGKYYYGALDIRTKQGLLRDINRAGSKEEAFGIMRKALDGNVDDVYRRTMYRISNKKASKNNNEVVRPNKSYRITKPCPHCHYNVMADPNTTYVVCGYSNELLGYDWNGCGRDWCFRCGKILCKKWNDNELFLDTNRFHDGECCKKHAKSNNMQYPDDYCQCTNKYVDRNGFT